MAARLVQLFAENLLPMFLIIGLGFLCQRALKFDLRTLNKANIYIFVPALLLDRFLQATITARQGLVIALLASAGVLLMLAIGRFTTPLRGRQKTYAPVVALSGAFANTGNFGIPLMGLFFGPAGVVVQSILIMVNNLLVYSVGVYTVAHAASWRQTMINFFRTPIPFAFLLAAGLLATDRVLPGPVADAVRYLGDGLIPVALITLGAQLAESRIGSRAIPITWAVILRLIISPVVMALLVYLASLAGLLAFDSLPARVLIVSAAIPAAVNTVIVSMEYEAHPDVAAGAILIGTPISAATLTLVLYLVGA